MLVYLAVGLPRDWYLEAIRDIHMAAIDRSGMRLRILLSFWYYSQSDLDALFAQYFIPPYPDVFADSGAFSAFSQGGAIDITEYADWLHQWSHLFTAYANLDVKGSGPSTIQKGLDNLVYLEKRGLQPIPVFHAGEPFSLLSDFVQSYPYVALGGIAKDHHRRNEIMRWLVQCFQIAKGKAALHGFGMTGWRFLRALPWYSVDSSSWGQGFRYGRVPIFDYRSGRFIKLTLGDRQAWYRNASLVKSLGFDPEDFADRARYSRAKTCGISAISFMLAEQWLRKWHGEIRIPNRDDLDPGPHLHLSDANPKRYGDAMDGGVKLHLADTGGGANFGDASKGLYLYLADSRSDLRDTGSAHEHLKRVQEDD